MRVCGSGFFSVGAWLCLLSLFLILSLGSRASAAGSSEMITLTGVDMHRIIPLVDAHAEEGMGAGRRLPSGGSRLSCWIEISYDSGIQMLQQVDVLGLRTAAGEELDPLPLPGTTLAAANRRIKAGREDREGGRGVPLRLDFAYPQHEFVAIDRLAGKCQGLAFADVQELELASLADWYGKTYQLDDLPDSFVTIHRLKDDVVQVFFSNDFRHRFRAMSFEDGDGNHVKATALSLSRAENKAHVLYRVELTAKTKATIAYFRSVEHVSIPFKFQDVQLPPPDSSGAGPADE